MRASAAHLLQQRLQHAPTSRILLSLVLSVMTLHAMDLGGNFWNLGWHQPNDCFEDFRNVRGNDPWNPKFLEEIAFYRSLRFMDWDNTNNSEREHWAQRPRKETSKQNPVAYEWMIDLCNRNQSDLWVTLPHRTITHRTGDHPSDYALRLCLLVKTGIDMGDTDFRPRPGRLATMTVDDLREAGGIKTCDPLEPNLKLYLEYSNETWNGMFKQAHYCCDEGMALGLAENRWTAGFRYHAWAAIRQFRAADLVFGTDSPRVVKVLATHSANSWVTGQHLLTLNDPTLNPWTVQATAIATAPYFGHNVPGDITNAVERLNAAIKKSEADSARHKAAADEAGLRLIAYEGGQHVIKQARSINQSPVMFDLYRTYLTGMARYFDHFCHYAHVGRAGDRGAWGAIEFTGQPVGEAPKYRALREWAKAEPPSEPDLPGGTLAGDRPRVIVSTDIGGSDPDDFQSMVHLLLYADVLDLEGLISSPPQAGRTKHIHECLDAYALDLPKLRQASAHFPSVESLRAIIKQGATEPAPARGLSEPTEGSRWIIEQARKADTRPLWILVWGSITDVAQAVHDAPGIKPALRVYSIGSWNTRQDPTARQYLFEQHPDLWWIESDTTFRGMYLGGKQEGDLGNRAFVERHVKDHGALGDLFYAKKREIKMGDTPSVLFLLRGNPENPTRPSWGGRYTTTNHGSHYWHDDAHPDQAEGERYGAKTVNRWREAYLRDWQRRMDWLQ